MKGTCSPAYLSSPSFLVLVQLKNLGQGVVRNFWGRVYIFLLGWVGEEGALCIF